MPNPTITLRRMALMAAVETVSGTFVMPVAADAIEVADVTITPTDGQTDEYNIVRPYMGSVEEILTTRFRKMAFKVGMAGVGTAGAVPGYSKLLRGCGLSATAVAGPPAKTVFAPARTSFESVSLYAVIDRNVYKMPGAAGNVRLQGSAGKLPWMAFEFTGAWRAVEVVGSIPVTAPVFQVPLGVNAANTRVRLGGAAEFWECNAFDIDLGNVVSKQDLTEIDNTEITDRRASGSITIRSTLQTTKDWDALIGTKQVLEITHGQAATNKVKIAAPLAQIGKPSFGEQDGFQMITLPLRLLPSGSSGNNEISIEV